MCKRIKTIVRLNDRAKGTQEVEGFAVDGAPGLAITEEQRSIGRWTITHVSSGLALPIWFYQAVDALRFALLCGKRADWEQPFPEKHGGKEAFVSAYHEMRRAVPMHFNGHSFGREPGAHELTQYRWYTTTSKAL